MSIDPYTHLDTKTTIQRKTKINILIERNITSHRSRAWALNTSMVILFWFRINTIPSKRYKFKLTSKQNDDKQRHTLRRMLRWRERYGSSWLCMLSKWKCSPNALHSSKLLFHSIDYTTTHIKRKLHYANCTKATEAEIFNVSFGRKKKVKIACHYSSVSCTVCCTSLGKINR